MKHASFLVGAMALMTSTVASPWGQADARPPPVGDFEMIGGTRPDAAAERVQPAGPVGLAPRPSNVCKAKREYGAADYS